MTERRFLASSSSLPSGRSQAGGSPPAKQMLSSSSIFEVVEPLSWVFGELATTIEQELDLIPWITYANRVP
jgi:hypothetical protein